jgi:hypothetical protein
MQRLRVCLNDIQFKSLPVALKIMTLNTVFDLSFISFTKFTSCLTIVDGSNQLVNFQSNKSLNIGAINNHEATGKYWE